MTSALAVGVVLVVTAAAVVTPRRAVLALPAVILLSPYLSFGALSLRVEHVLVPVLWVIVVAKGRFRFVCPVSSRLWLLFVLFLFCVTTFRVTSGNETHGFASGVYSYVLVFMLFTLFSTVSRTVPLLKGIVRSAVYCSVPLSLFALLQTLNVGWATNLTVDGYTSTSRVSVAKLMELTGYVVRGVSVFESPVYAAQYFLLALAASVFLLIEGRTASGWRERLVYAACAVFSLLGGVVTLSSTFVLGGACVAGALFLLARKAAGFKVMFAVLVLAGVLAFSLPLLVEENPAIQGNLLYQVGRITSLSVLETRYDPDLGQTAGTLRAVVESPFWGWGWVEHRGAFVGDSLYLTQLYLGGFIGFLVFGAVFLDGVPVVMRGKERGVKIFALWTAVMFLGGIGSPTLFAPRVGALWWAAFGAGAGQAARMRRDVRD
ncbi:MAG: hypothetical protein D6788_00675 [Planctomycetota bacterium]|nr:MAG: hypothetical protein D6788_00675 [Planctomycetota bacterium]